MAIPRIALNTSLDAERVSVGYFYVDKVRQAGGAPVILPPVSAPGALERQLEGVDGVVFIGGADYDPALYGKPTHPKVELVPKERQDYDLALCRAVLARRIPALGICGGLQLINIAAGGTLVVHTEGHRSGDPKVIAEHKVAIEAGSALARVLQATTLVVNSSHHQAADAPGKGLRVTAHAEDGCIEALEAADARFLLAVQWHPERMQTPESARLFAALVRAAAP
jgi:putative glutamine amidotransferase